MSLLVQKYGGTSVGNPERIRHVARRVIDTQRAGHRVVAVVSATEGITRAMTLGSPPEQILCCKLWLAADARRVQTVFALRPMPNTVTLEEAKTHLEDLVERARRGEELLIAGSAGQALVKLVLAEPETTLATKRWQAFGMMKGQIEMAPDFDDPLEEFKPYME